MRSSAPFNRARHPASSPELLRKSGRGRLLGVRPPPAPRAGRTSPGSSALPRVPESPEHPGSPRPQPPGRPGPSRATLSLGSLRFWGEGEVKGSLSLLLLLFLRGPVQEYSRSQSSGLIFIFFYLKSKFRPEVRFPARLPPGSAVALGRFPPGNVGSRWAVGGGGRAPPGLAKGLLLSPPNLAGKLNECLLEFLFDSIAFHYVPRAGVGRGEDTRPAPGTLHAGPALRPIRGCPPALPTSSYSHG